MPEHLKIDLHTHTSEDPTERIGYNAVTLIDRASEKGFDVLAITNHGPITYSEELAAYAEQKGILLIPGTEAQVSGRHVLILNPGFKKVPEGITLEELAEIKTSSSCVVAPHPFFPSPASLRSKLRSNLDVFDAIEFSHYYNHLVNSNRKAVQIAQQSGLPMIGNSDCHLLWQLGSTYSLIRARKNVHSVLEAVKTGKAEIRTAPLSLVSMCRIALCLLWMKKRFPFYG
jgi:predicted metal-dependent phosphoesterase TrpH